MKRDQLDILTNSFFFLHRFYLFTFGWALVFTSHGLSLGAAGSGYSSCAAVRLLIWWHLIVGARALQAS